MMFGIYLNSSFYRNRYVFYNTKKHLYLMGALLVVHLYQLYDYRMLPVVKSTVYAGGAYDSQDIEGAIVELPIGYAKPTITHQIYHKRPVFGGMGEHFYFTAC